MTVAESVDTLRELANLARYYILTSTSRAESGHPTSSLSAVELMIGLLFGGEFHYYVDNPRHPNNDRLIFSKGHASPLFYALWAVAGRLSENDLLTYRQFGSSLEGHPSVAFPYTEAATGSLGQGLSIGIGEALNAKYLDQLNYRTYVLLGDSEMAEGSQWEALQLAAWYRLDNLVGVLDVNRLGQRGETMYGHNLAAYDRRIAAFGWHTIVIDGHDIEQVRAAYIEAREMLGRPTMIIAKTLKGKGIPFLEDKNDWHGKAVEPNELESALTALGPVNKDVHGEIARPEEMRPKYPPANKLGKIDYQRGQSVATRDAYGKALVRIATAYPNLVCLDGEVSNSTKSDQFQKAYPTRFFECYIAEQNMVGMATGLALRGKIPFVSTFAAFLTRAFDQIRMAAYSEANIKLVGSHAGVAIGEDGPSQMGLEDLAMCRSVLNSVVLYPCDAVAADRLVEEAARHVGIVYLRTTRGTTPVIYSSEEQFPIGGCKVLRSSPDDRLTLVAAGVTVHESLAAYESLRNQNIPVRVIDLYSVKPVDQMTLCDAGMVTGRIMTVEDHFAEGGIADAVRTAVAVTGVPVYSLAVRKKPRSGKPAELLDFERISRGAIVQAVHDLLGFQLT
mgnify:CR=1 FL=1